MNRTSQINGEDHNGSEHSNWSTIRRTLVERGLRSVRNLTNNKNSQNGPSTTISTITKQHEDEQRELQELNTKLSTYLDHVHNLETYNGQLLAELDSVREKWGANTEQLNAKYGPQLQTLRYTIDNSLRDQVLQELQLKQYEYDIWQTQQRINAFDDDTKNRLNEVQQELQNSIDDLEKLKNQFDRRSADLIQQRTKLKNLGNEFDGLQIELLNHRLERIMVENELQTLQEDATFQDANYQAQREQILSLS
jgi:chromosome segregation ATPase